MLLYESIISHLAKSAAHVPEGGGSISCRKSSKATLICESCVPILFSMRASLLANSSCPTKSFRRRTKARMISMLMRTARWLRSRLESIATPCSVKTLGGVRRPPQLEVTICDLKMPTSCRDKTNIKSFGNRSRFLFTA